jgi:hypothetical protein
MHSSCQQARDCTTSTNNDVLHHALRPNEVHELKSSTSSSLLTSRLFSTARDRPARLIVSIPSQQQTNWSLLTHPSFQPACAPRTYPSMDHAHAVSEIGENLLSSSSTSRNHRWNSCADNTHSLARPQSQAGQLQAHAHHRQMSSATLPDTFQRSRSDTMTSTKSRQRPKSRGSTTSIQSAGTAAHYQQDHPQSHGLFIAPQQQQQLYNASPDEFLAQYGQETQTPFAQTQQYNIDAALSAQQQNEIQNHDMQQYGIHAQDFPQSGMGQYGTSHEHMQHAIARAATFDAAENQSPAPEDSETADNGQRRKKGSATSLANDAELRRLVHQYQGQTLKDVAAEVQQNEGGGGRSEKAKQVFAMLW